MEKRERNNYTIRLFSYIVRQTILSSFSFPGGGVSYGSVSTCLDSLEKLNKGTLSQERITDFCISQVYAISGFNEDYFRKWKASHSFGKKAIERFINTNRKKKYFEDIWLKKYDLSRNGLLELYRDKKDHPLSKFIYPEYEEVTKSRLLNTEAGYCICQLSTLLYTPFSPTCRACEYSTKCEAVIKQKYQELYRIRIESYKKP